MTNRSSTEGVAVSGRRARWMAKRKSSAVTGAPLLHLASPYRWKVNRVLFSLTSHLRAAPGMTSPWSSMPHSPWKMEPMTWKEDWREAVWGSRVSTFWGRAYVNSMPA